MNDIKLPYILKDKVLMVPGIWNNNPYDAVEIIKSFKNTDWNNLSLVLDHEDDSIPSWVGQIKNARLLGEKIIGDLAIVDEDTARKLAFGAKFGVSPKLKGIINSADNSVKDIEYENFAIVINPAQGKATLLNSAHNITKVSLMLKEEKKLNTDMNSCMLMMTQAGYPQDVAQKMCETAMGMMQPQNGGNTMGLNEEFSTFKDETTKTLSAMKELVEKLAQQKNDAGFLGRQTGSASIEQTDFKKIGREEIKKLAMESPRQDRYTLFLNYMKGGKTLRRSKGDEQ